MTTTLSKTDVYAVVAIALTREDQFLAPRGDLLVITLEQARKLGERKFNGLEDVPVFERFFCFRGEKTKFFFTDQDEFKECLRFPEFTLVQTGTSFHTHLCAVQLECMEEKLSDL